MMFRYRCLSLWLVFSIFLCFSFSIVATNPYEDILSNEAYAEFTEIAVYLCIVGLILPIIFSLLLGIWLYKDAEQRGKNGILWFIILFVFSVFLNFLGILLVFIIWFVTRPPVGVQKITEQQKDQRRCINCGRVIPSDARICPYCGKHFD